MTIYPLLFVIDCEKIGFKVDNTFMFILFIVTLLQYFSF